MYSCRHYNVRMGLQRFPYSDISNVFLKFCYDSLFASSVFRSLIKASNDNTAQRTIQCDHYKSTESVMLISIELLLLIITLVPNEPLTVSNFVL